LPVSALLLVLVAGLVHASWNLISKRTNAGANFVMLYSGLSCVLYMPLAIWFGMDSVRTVSGSAWLWLLLSGMLHLVYALLLQRGYQAGDLSVVYPVARGSGQLLAAIGAIILLGETITPLTVLGYATVLLGIAMIGWSGRDPSSSLQTGLVYGLAIGLAIGCYTLVDARTVRVVHLHPLLIDYNSNAVRTLLLLPVMIRRGSGLQESWRVHRGAALAVAALSPIAYILVLTAMRIAPVSRVAPAREVAMLFAVLLSALVLRERQAGIRFVAAGLIAAGVVALAWR
jgi:drug/metabolite transporter (DMT)-like permease